MMMAQWNQAIRRLLRVAGFEVHRRAIRNAPDLQLNAILRLAQVDTVVDVGANEGQFGVSLRAAGYRGRIISFEPLRAAHARLARRSEADPAWTVPERAAIGEQDGEVEIHVSANSYSSSVLPMLARHTSAAPDSQVVGTERVPLRRLDSVLPGTVDPGNSVFLKIDTQGYEDRVLAGARETLKSIRGLQLELSLVGLYQGQVLFLEMVKLLDEAGFGLYALNPEFVDPVTGQTLQVNGVFLRR
jgi:FkbM family methyltransferase